MLQNKNIKIIISVVIAIVLWVYVIGEVNPTKTQKIENVPVKILNEDNLTQRNLIILDENEYTVTLEVEGKRADINGLSKDGLIVTANVFGRGIGENYIPIEVTTPEYLNLVGTVPAKILVNIDELVSVHKPLEVKFLGEFAENTEPGAMVVQPEEIEVKGAKSNVEKVKYVKAEIPAQKVTKEMNTISVDAIAINDVGEPVYNVTLSSNMVDVTTRLSYLKTVPLNVEIRGEVPSGYEATKIVVPDKVTIKGKKSSLAEIETIYAEPVDISKTNISGLIPLKPVLPSGVELANESNGIAVEISIKGIITEEFEIESSKIVMEGLQEGMAGYINISSVVVTASGSEELMNQVTADDFKLFVDMTNYTAGTYTGNVRVECEKNVKTIMVTPKAVPVTINESI